MGGAAASLLHHCHIHIFYVLPPVRLDGLDSLAQMLCKWSSFLPWTNAITYRILLQLQSFSIWQGWSSFRRGIFVRCGIGSSHFLLDRENFTTGLIFIVCTFSCIDHPNKKNQNNIFLKHIVFIQFPRLVQNSVLLSEPSYPSANLHGWSALLSWRTRVKKTLLENLDGREILQ